MAGRGGGLRRIHQRVNPRSALAASHQVTGCDEVTVPATAQSHMTSSGLLELEGFMRERNFRAQIKMDKREYILAGAVGKMYFKNFQDGTVIFPALRESCLLHPNNNFKRQVHVVQ